MAGRSNAATGAAVKGHNHLSVTYDKVRSVLSQPPDRRKDFEITSILPWFLGLKDTKVLGQLKQHLLFDVIKSIQFIMKKKDELVIRQGDQGDCMFIMLRGQVTIYHNYGVTSDGSGEDGDAAVARSVASATTGEALRQQLGAFVVTLKDPGVAFGEVALLSDNGTRSASIIADEPTDLIVIDRALYNRSVQQVVQREFEQKQTFIKQHPVFRSWQGKYLKQLTMALEKEIYSYEHVVCRQSLPVDAIYFIISGEVKFVMDPQLHYSQYPKLIKNDRKTVASPASTAEQQVNDALQSFSPRNGISNNRKASKRQQTVEVCYLGVNEAVGDVEALMNLPTYMQTAICTQSCELLVLNMKHYDRLFVRRNPKTIDIMRSELELRIRSRITSSYLSKTVPLLDSLIAKASEYSKAPRSTSNGDENGDSSRRPRNGNKCGGNADGLFIPTQGALLDQFGPGTVFYHIRQNDARKSKLNDRNRKAQQVAPNRLYPSSLGNSQLGSTDVETVDVSRVSMDVVSGGNAHNVGGGLTTVDVDLGRTFTRSMSDFTTLQTTIASTTITNGPATATTLSRQQSLILTSQSIVNGGVDNGMSRQNGDSGGRTAKNGGDEAAIEELENRVREFLRDDEELTRPVDEMIVVNPQGAGGAGRKISVNHLQHQQQVLQRATLGPKQQPRVQRLHRASAGSDQLRPGVKIIMRQRRINVTPYRLTGIEQQEEELPPSEELVRTRFWSDSELNYYRSALTEPIPTFSFRT